MSYDTYGIRCSICSISTPFGFEGGYTDATGLVYWSTATTTLQRGSS